LLASHHTNGYFSGAIDVHANGIDVGKAVPCLGKAGSASFHHVRAVHGSAENTSSKSRALLFYEIDAVDAWPLSGVSDLEEFNNRILAGTPTIAPRMTDVPVRMQLPPALKQGSIYENQLAIKKSTF
jgi:phytanoyl-CoA hydroxylase